MQSLNSKIANKQFMGRIIPSYRIASEMEIWKWRPFRKLLDKQDRKVFDEMLKICRFYNVAGNMAARPILIHVILMSIILNTTSN